MSQHIIKHQHYEIRLGWDAALETYYASVVNSSDEEFPIIWIGTSLNEYPEPGAFLNVLKRELIKAEILDVNIPLSIKELTKEKEAEGSTFSEKYSDIQRLVTSQSTGTFYKYRQDVWVSKGIFQFIKYTFETTDTDLTWVIDVIMSYQRNPGFCNDPYLRHQQYWDLYACSEDRSVIISCDNDNYYSGEHYQAA